MNSSKAVGVKELSGQWHIVVIEVSRIDGTDYDCVPFDLDHIFPTENSFVFGGFSRSGNLFYFEEVVDENEI